MEKREIKMGSVQAFLIRRSIISVSPGIAGRRTYVPPEHPDTEELAVGAYMIRYTSVISNRFDSTTFKRLYSDLYKDFTKPVSSRRFTISC